MRAVVFLILFLFSFAQAHEGHDDDSHPPAAIENGKLKGNDDLIYLDAGAYVTWAGQKLKRKVSESNQVVYQFNDELKDLTSLSSGPDKYLELKVPGAEILKAFSFDHAGEMHDQLDISSPDFTSDVVVSKSKDLPLRWKADSTASMVKVIIEVYLPEGKLAGRITISTKDDGEYDVPAKFLSQLPAGDGKIAVKRIWFGEFQSNKEKGEMIGVKCVVSAVGKAKVLED